MASHSGTGSLANFTDINASGSAASIGDGTLSLSDTSRSLAAGTLTVAISDIGFTSSPADIALLASSLTQAFGTNSVAFAYYYDTTNTLFGLGTFMGSDLLTPAPDQEAEIVAGPPSSPYSMTVVATVTHSGAVSAQQQTLWQGSINIRPIPEPSTLALAVLGLWAMSFCRRKRA